jgi:hypothetical protein
MWLAEVAQIVPAILLDTTLNNNSSPQLQFRGKEQVG